MKEIHEIQRKILLKLLFSQGLRYLELKTDPKMENSQFDFHLDTLQEQGYIAHDGNLYTLTPTGKEYANRFDSDSGTYKKQSKVSVWVCGVRQNNGEDEFLIGTRQKSPFFGAQGFLAGKLDYGESVVAGAKREMKEESGLDAEPVLIHIRHYINKNKETNEVIEDKFMFLFIARNPTGTLRDCNENTFNWVKKSELKEKITKPFDNIEAFLQDIALLQEFNGIVTFEERERWPENF